jgi:hypothetical protein
MGYNFFGTMVLVFTVLKYRRVVFTYCSEYRTIYCTRTVQIQKCAKWLSLPRAINIASGL